VAPTAIRTTSHTAAIALLTAVTVSVSGCAATEPGVVTTTAAPTTSVPAPGTASAAAPSAAASEAPAGGSGTTASVTRAAPRVVRTLAKNIRTPWGITFLPDGRALVGSRDTGRVYRLKADGGKRRVGTVPGVVSNGSSGGEAGLLGLAVSPRFGTDHRVYAYFSSGSDNRIAWMKFRSGGLGRPHVILRGIPRGLHHNGGGLRFGPDGKLYASTGESGNAALAQSRSSLGGKVLRMTRNGKVPKSGNPFRGSLVYSYGHRNVEGIAFDRSGRLWATEFGDKAYDELNLIRPGHNYGWPATQGRTSNPSYTSPKLVWRTYNAGPAGIAIVGGTAWIGALTGKRLYRVQLSGTHASHKKAFFTNRYGRIRAVAAPPGGSAIWVGTSNTDGRATPRRGDDRILLVRVG
jgi:glucose/arabinose dehydrogenase